MITGMKKKWEKTDFIPLFVLYLVYVAIRYVFAMLTTAYPTVGIDEFLYYSLGRSIATEGRLLYRGQPALYNFIVYPLCIAPVYGIFPEGSDFYRIIQLWNGLLMNLAVFPIFRFCKDLFSNQKKAFWVTAAVMLFPDFSLNEFFFSEAIIYPLFFSLAYLIYKAIHEENTGRNIWIGILGALLYYTKPGAIVPAAVFLLGSLLAAIIRRDKKKMILKMIGLAAFAVAFLIIWAIARYALGYNGPFFSVYNKQINTDSNLHLDYFFQTVACYPYYFILASGIIPGILFVTKIGSFGKKERLFYSCMIVSAALVLIGTAWFINRVERTHSLLLRYSAMYIPLVFIGCLIPVDREKKVQSVSGMLPGIAVCTYLIVCTAIWGSTTGIAAYVENHFLVSLAILFQPYAKGISDILIYLISFFALYLAVKNTGRKIEHGLLISAFLVCSIINNFGGYIATGSNAIQYLRDEAIDVQKNQIKGEEYLYVFSNEFTSDHGLNVYTKNNNQHLEWYDFFNNIHNHGGAYAPFEPVAERGMSDVSVVTPDVNILVAEATTYPLIKFSENIQGKITEHDSFYVGKFQSGARIVDAMLGNIEKFKLLRTDYGVLTLYRDDWVNHPVRISLVIESPVKQHMRFFANDTESLTIELEAGKNNYEFRIPKAAKGYNFYVDQSDIMVYGFDVESWTD